MPSIKRNVDRILKARGLSESDLSKRTGHSRAEIENVLSDPSGRRRGILNEIATELVVPEFFLFSTDLTPETTIADFRQSTPTKRGYQRATIKAIEFAKEVQADASTRDAFKPNSALVNQMDGKNEKERAASLRERIGLSIAKQFEFKDSRLLYAFVRRQIEALETLVFQWSFPSDDGAGFAITSPKSFNSIVVNTKGQIYSRRLFTLAHEVYHCVLNQTGMSDPDVIKNDIERRCNKFAVQFLAPVDLVELAAKQTIHSSNFDVDELRSFSELTKLSMAASLYRLVETGRYSDNAIAQWKAYIKQVGSPDLAKRGGGRRQAEWKYKLGKYGTTFARVYSRAVEEGDIDDYELFRLSGIKPKYQNEYLTNALTAALDDAQDEAE
ncbi:Zn-dependent peptidase ImmA (M78 family)/transcriptional regulator with XRE-family HTH domain [Bradyrhizobium sp. USDA 4502]